MVAPGMICQYTVQFFPDCLGDFDDFIVVETQSAHPLLIPLQARRPPPVLTCECVPCSSPPPPGIRSGLASPYKECWLLSPWWLHTAWQGLLGAEEGPASSVYSLLPAGEEAAAQLTPAWASQARGHP